MAFHTPRPVDTEVGIISPRTFRIVLFAVLAGTILPLLRLFQEGSAPSWILLAFEASLSLGAIGSSFRGWLRASAILVCLGAGLTSVITSAETGMGLLPSIILCPAALVLAGFTLRRSEFRALAAIICIALLIATALGAGNGKSPADSLLWTNVAEVEIILLGTAVGLELIAGGIRTRSQNAPVPYRGSDQAAAKAGDLLAKNEELRRELAHVLEEKDALAQEILRSEERFRRLSETASEGIAITEGGIIREVNDQATRMLGYEVNELVGRPIMDVVAPESRELVKGMIGDQKSGPYEHLALRKDGSIFPVEVRARMIPREGKRARITAIYDVTERKAGEKLILDSLQAKETLLKEIHHRVKNNLQVVSSLLSLEAQRSSDEKTRSLFLETKNRIRSMALVHERLYRSPEVGKIDLGEYLRSISEELVRSAAREGLACSIDAEQVSLGVDVAVPCGLLAHELLSNALTHAFVGRQTGQVEVTLRRTGEHRIELSVRDNGVGFPGDFRTMTSMGLTLVNSLAAQMGGDIVMESRGGTRFTITFPA